MNVTQYTNVSNFFVNTEIKQYRTSSFLQNVTNNSQIVASTSFVSESNENVLSPFSLTDIKYDNFCGIDTWTKKTSAPLGIKNWKSIGMSTSGQYQTAVCDSDTINNVVYISYDYGITFEARILPITYGSNTTWVASDVNVSTTGQYQVLLITGTPNSYIYNSNNYGETWIQNSVNNSPFSVSCISSSGKYQYVFTNNEAFSLYRSTDYGVKFEKLQLTIHVWQDCACSSSGQYIILLGQDTYVFYSNDYGNNFYPIETLGIRNWKSCSLSSTGQYQLCLAYNNLVYRSLNYGKDWINVDSLGQENWIASCINGSGQIQVVANYGGNLHYSLDYGNIWSVITGINPSTNNWKHLSISSTGQYLSLVTTNEYLYVCKNIYNTPTIQENMNGSFTNINISDTLTINGDISANTIRTDKLTVNYLGFNPNISNLTKFKMVTNQATYTNFHDVITNSLLYSGIVSNGEGYFTVNFNYTFVNVPQVFIDAINSSSFTDKKNMSKLIIMTGSINSTNFRCYIKNFNNVSLTSVTINWLAIGY